MSERVYFVTARQVEVLIEALMHECDVSEQISDGRISTKLVRHIFSGKPVEEFDFSGEYK